MTSTAILSIDEGTTGTRAALVSPEGKVSCVNYRRLSSHSPRSGVVEQDANTIIEETINAIRATTAQAKETNTEIVGVAITNQRATAVLWDVQTGMAVVPAMVWQDTRHVEKLEQIADSWDQELIQHCGRSTGVRSPYLWAAQHIRENPEVAALHQSGRLRFGTIDGWLVWNLTKERRCVASATNATSSGAFRLRENSYHTGYIEALGFPADLLPEIVEDRQWLGTGRAEIFGTEVPILAAIGDQHAAMIGLGCVENGKAMVVHGTGSFCDLITGTSFPSNPGKHEGTLTLTGWRADGVSSYSVESHTATTGSAFDWFCERLGWFENAMQISDFASRTDSSHGVLFIPTLTGIRVPVVDHRVRAGITGISTATTKADVAYALLEGVAHFVRSSLECNVDVAGIEPNEVVVGGGVSASDTLIQIQADYSGLPMRRRSGTAEASLRGAAFLAGSGGLMWDGLGEAVSTLDKGQLFEPRMGSDQRESIAATWRRRIDREIAEVKEN
ncbi:glycerol kinase [Arthrobacter alpinus]|uniref:ATP:glycerol 3-phosphotransferase n=1 Tax=Arthrobacter alpinus TaxID=656366 RepID=A0A0M4QDP6_9MICC|nr:FGGY family carbohydrate kinase [Arthrobacter alpinus]ALE91180.1 glycerol kinase [Arthrobacter alpinus]